MGWSAELHRDVEEWFLALAERDPVSAGYVEQALDMLVACGPGLGRPLVDRIKGSRFHNLKELRPASGGRSEIRMLFAFDPRRSALVLVAGDKAGNWKGWYEVNIPLAEKRYARHVAELEG
ncbi:hypothetical protein GCM10027597_07090 [Saccharopolyspora tripterygii]